MPNRDNVLEFRPKPPTPEELEAWRRFVDWAKDATFADWENLYGSQAKELYERFYRLFYDFAERQRRVETKPVK
jgi:hypothetical protein